MPRFVEKLATAAVAAVVMAGAAHADSRLFSARADQANLTITGATLAGKPLTIAGQHRSPPQLPQGQVVQKVAARTPAHWPAMHISSEAHWLPHWPQFAGSSCRFAHVPLQVTVPGAQPAPVHAPFEHTWPPPHRTPQPPQLAGSVVGSTHCPLHSASPGQQLHAPWRQN